MKKLLFAENENNHRKPQLIKMQWAIDHSVSCPNLYTYKTTPNLSVKNDHKKRYKDFKSQKTRTSAVTFSNDAFPKLWSCMVSVCLHIFFYQTICPYLPYFFLKRGIQTGNFNIYHLSPSQILEVAGWRLSFPVQVLKDIPHWSL